LLVKVVLFKIWQQEGKRGDVLPVVAHGRPGRLDTELAGWQSAMGVVVVMTGQADLLEVV
jgi:hypothetical protein